MSERVPGIRASSPPILYWDFHFSRRFVTVGDRGAIGKCQWRCRDALVVGGSRGIRIKPLDNRSDESEAELCHFGIMFHCFGIFTHGKSPPSYVFYIIIGETSGNHPMVVWSEDGDIRSEDSLMIPCILGRLQYGVPVGLRGRNGTVAG